MARRFLTQKAMTKIKIGKIGEEIARNYLVKNNYEIKANNFRFGRWGEVDIIATQNQIYYFIEVKTRSNKNFGWPEEAVSEAKLKKISLVAQNYLEKNNLANHWQIDIISIILNHSSHYARLWHIKNLR